MKKKLLLFTALFAFILNSSAQESIIKDVFEQFVETKIERMQKLNGYDDKKASQFIELELKFLLDVKAAENCLWSRTKKRIKKLNKQRDNDLQLILTREQYIKYNAIDNNLIQKNPPVQL